MKSMVEFFLGCLLTLLIGCGTSQTKVSSAENSALNGIMSSQSFEIVCDVAEPQVTNGMNAIANAGLLPIGSTVGSINLIGNSNFFRMENDTISAYLPYFGERQMGGGYNGTDGIAIQFNGVPSDLAVEHGKNNTYDIYFDISDEKSSSERYSVYVKVYSNLTSSIRINSNQRFPISYRGNITKKEKI
jgi:hypothetical protein